jgi:hypothetical protein
LPGIQAKLMKHAAKIIAARTCMLHVTCLLLVLLLR